MKTRSIEYNDTIRKRILAYSWWDVFCAKSTSFYSPW